MDEAVRLMADKGSRARALAGGTDVLVQLRAKRYLIDRLVDIKKIPEAQLLSEFDKLEEKQAEG